MPVIGMGTGCYPPVSLEATKSAILEAIRVGYRHFDIAFIYGSEQPLGEATPEALRLGLVKKKVDGSIRKRRSPLRRSRRRRRRAPSPRKLRRRRSRRRGRSCPRRAEQLPETRRRRGRRRASRR
ncbi:hypothetical protein ACSBR1_020951 [Camellia fascicularis]